MAKRLSFTAEMKSEIKMSFDDETIALEEEPLKCNRKQGREL